MISVAPLLPSEFLRYEESPHGCEKLQHLQAFSMTRGLSTRPNLQRRQYSELHIRFFFLVACFNLQHCLLEFFVSLLRWSIKGKVQCQFKQLTVVFIGYIVEHSRS